jgi:hypothetical protein
VVGGFGGVGSAQEDEGGDAMGEGVAFRAALADVSKKLASCLAKSCFPCGYNSGLTQIKKPWDRRRPTRLPP